MPTDEEKVSHPGFFIRSPTDALSLPEITKAEINKI